jgi:hypothetical protein
LCNLGAELRLNLGNANIGILDHIMQQCRGDHHLAMGYGTDDFGDGHRVNDIGLVSMLAPLTHALMRGAGELSRVSRDSAGSVLLARLFGRWGGPPTSMRVFPRFGIAPFSAFILPPAISTMLAL